MYVKKKFRDSLFFSLPNLKQSKKKILQKKKKIIILILIID